MARFINLSTPECGVTDGMELSFRAPCDCSNVTGISLDGKPYTIVDASGESLTSCSGYFRSGAILTVIIDTVNSKATLLNPRTNTYTKSLGTPEDVASSDGTTVWSRVKNIEDDMNNKAPKSHEHTKAQITDFAHNHDDRYFTEDEVNAKLNNKSDNTHKHKFEELEEIPTQFTPASHTHTVAEISNFPSTMTPSKHSHSKSDITDFPASMPASDVYSWAKAPQKPSYTADEVGAIGANGGAINNPLSVSWLTVKRKGSGSLPSVAFEDNSEYNEAGKDVQLGVISINPNNRKACVSLYNKDQDAKTDRKSENYYFPTPNTGLTSGKAYDILTSKNLDSEPKSGSTNPITSDGVYKAISNLNITKSSIAYVNITGKLLDTPFELHTTITVPTELNNIDSEIRLRAVLQTYFSENFNIPATGRCLDGSVVSLYHISNVLVMRTTPVTRGSTKTTSIVLGDVDDLVVSSVVIKLG